MIRFLQMLIGLQLVLLAFNVYFTLTDDLMYLIFIGINLIGIFGADYSIRMKREEMA